MLGQRLASVRKIIFSLIVHTFMVMVRYIEIAKNSVPYVTDDETVNKKNNNRNTEKSISLN